MVYDIFNGENDLAGYLLVSILLLPAGWIVMKILDWWDRQPRR